MAREILPKPVRDDIDRTIAPHLMMRANKQGASSVKTEEERHRFAHRMVADLWELGYKIRKLESLSVKHVGALMTYWHEKGIVAGTLHTRLSMIRIICGWMGKRNVVRHITQYLPEEVVRRQAAVTESKAWEDKGIDPLEVIEKAKAIDERFAVMLAMQHHFGLRVKESIELRPANAVVDGGQFLELYEGTKGGRPRRVPIRTDEQRKVLEWARRVAASGRSKRLRWPDRTWNQAQNRFYYLFNSRLGITREELGISPHGLRHGFSHRDYEYRTGGLLPPVKGGSLGKIDRETHFMATMSLSSALGHGRPDIVPSYCGSYGHQLRMAPATKVTVNVAPEIHALAEGNPGRGKGPRFV